MKPLVWKAVLDSSDFMKKIGEAQQYAKDSKKKLDQKHVLELEFKKVAADAKVKELRQILKNKDLNAARRIMLEIDLTRAKKQAVEANRLLNNYLNTGNEGLSRFGAAFPGIGKSLMSFIGGPVGIISASIGMLAKGFNELKEKAKIAINFESFFAGVKKTIEATAGGFQGLKKELKDLTTQIPLSFEEISKIAELGGQLGIAKKDIREFTRIVANLGTSTNLSTEAAGNALAKIANVFQLSSKDYEKLGNVIVQLGNNFATTESEIVDFSSYLMASARTAGFTADEVFAIGATLSSVGIKAEAGGSAFSKAISVINTAVATGDTTVKDFAKVAGLSAEEFAKQWREKPAEAFTKFVEGLGNEGALAIPIIQDLLGNNIRLQNGMLATANAGGLLRKSLSMAHEEYKNGNALQTEADKRYETMRSEITMLDGQLANMSDTLGKRLAPAMVRRKELLVDVHGWVNKLFGATDVFSEYLGKLTDKITENEESMKKLTEAYREGEITKEEYIKGLKDLGDEKAKLKQAYKEEEKMLSQEEEALKKNQKEIDKLNEKKERLNERLPRSKKHYEELTEKGFWFSRMADNQRAESNRLEQALSKLADEEKKLIEQKAQLESANTKREVSNYSLKDTFDLVRDAIKKLNDFRLNESGTRAEFEKTKQAALDSIDAFEKRLRMIGAHGSNVVSRYVNTQMAQYVSKAKGRLAGLTQKTTSMPESLSVGKTPTGGSGGGGSKKDPVAKKKEELKKMRDIAIEEIQQSDQSEKEKFKNILRINEEYKTKLVDLEGKTTDEIVKKAEDAKNQEEKIVKDKYQKINRELDNSKNFLKQYGKEVEDLQKKWKDTLDGVKNEIRDLNHDMQQLDQDYYSDIAERYVQVQGELSKDNLDEEERNKLQEELNFLMEKTTEEQRKQAEEAAKLSQAQKMEIDYQKQKAALQEKINIAKAFSSQESFSERKIEIGENEDGSLRASYTDEKGEVQQVTDYKNIQYLADLANKQIAMDQEMEALKVKIEEEVKIHNELTQKKAELEKNQTEILKEEMEKRKQEISDYVDHYEKEGNRQVDIAKRIASEMKAAAAEYLAAKASMGQGGGTTVNNNGGNTTNNTYNINNPSDASMAVFKSMNDRATPL